MRNRTTTFVFLALLALPLSASAQVPTFVPVQGFLTDAENAPVQGETTLQLSLYAGSIGGTALFQETHSVLLEDGFFTVYLGAQDPLDMALFRDNASLFLGVSVNGEAEMTPRLVVGTAPYAGFAEFAGDAKTLDGHAAADFRPSADAIGWDDLSGVPDNLLDGDADTLAGLTCAQDAVPKWDGSAWACGDDLDTQLGEAQVEAYVTNGPIDLAASSTMDGQPISTGAHTTSLDWTAINNRPAGLDDGDDDTIITSLDWTAITNRPVGLDDGDDDTQLDEGQVEAFITNGDLDMGGNAITNLADPADPADAAHKDYVDQQLATLQAQVTALLAEKQRRHEGAVYRWATFDTYQNNGGPGWAFNNTAALFGGVSPSHWTDGSYVAANMSYLKEVLRTLLTRKGYGGSNAMVYSEVFHQYSSTTGKVVVVLFRIRNTTNATISWTPEFYYTCYAGWNERAGLALNGANIWNSGGTNCGVNNHTAVALTIPANRTSTVIVTSTSNTAYNAGSGFYVRFTGLAFDNDSLALPSGLEYIDDLDIATGGWSQ